MRQYIKVPMLGTGRSVFGVEQSFKKLPAAAAEALAARVDAVRSAADTQDAVTERWAAAQKEGTRRGATRAVDLEIDGHLSVVHGICTALARLGAGNAQGEAAQAFLTRFFPAGLAAFINRNFEDELRAIEKLLAVLGEPEPAGWVAALPIDEPLAAVRALAPQYRAELERDKIAADFDSVKAAHQATIHAVRRYLGGLYFLLDADALADALQPIDLQAKQYLDHRRRNRKVPDVDRQTGEELTVGTPDAGEGAESD